MEGVKDLKYTYNNTLKWELPPTEQISIAHCKDTDLGLWAEETLYIGLGNVQMDG